MRKRLAAAVGVLMATAAIGAPSALGATDFGDSCLADSPAPGDYTLTGLTAAGGPIPLTAPTSGVITKFTINSKIGIPISVPASVKVLHPAGGTQFTVTGQSTMEISPGGVSVAAARLPVQAGDHVGIHGLPFTFLEKSYPGFSFYCSGTGDGSTLGAAMGDPQPGQTADFPSPAEGRVPLVATIEADGDGDGYGDETQDLCPLGASTQAACPVIVLDAYAIPGKSAITVLVSTSTEATATVSGTVALPKAKGKASSSAKAKLKKVKKKVKPGQLKRFTLKFPGNLKAALAALAPGKSLTAKITASSTNAAGKVSTDKTKVKLK